MRSILFLALTLSATVSQAADQKNLDRANDASRVLSEIMRAPDKRIPNRLIDEAEAIAVIPDVVKAGLVVGGRHGKGLLAIRAPDRTWSNPTYVSISGGSIGFQAGVQSTDVVLVFRTRRGVDSVVNGKFTLGADAAVAAGPVGRNAQAATDDQLKAEIYSYSRSRGLFAGVALDGSILAVDHKANQDVYGEKTRPRKIFEGRIKEVPPAVVDFRDRLEEYAAAAETADAPN